MMSKKVKKVVAYGGAVMCSLGIILAVPLIIHPNASGGAVPPGDEATVVSFTNGNENTIHPNETCTIVYRLDGDLIQITETLEYCQTIKAGDKIKI
jgi:hypothetical protein